MKREKLISISLLFIATLYLTGRVFFSEHGMGKAYVRTVEVKSSKLNSELTWTKYVKTTQRNYHEAVTKDPTQTEYKFSWSRTIGIWVAAFFTLFILSFLYKDNPLYKIAEHIFVGVSAGYIAVYTFWSTIWPNLFGRLWPAGEKSDSILSIILEVSLNQPKCHPPFSTILKFMTYLGEIN